MPHVFGQLVNEQPNNILGLLRTLRLETPCLPQNEMQATVPYDNISAALTAAIKSDPSFTAALVAAITSILGNSHDQNQQNGNNSTTTGNSSDMNT